MQQCDSSTATPSYFIDGKPIKTADSHKDLGILVTSNLSWSEHINSICSSAYKSLHLIRRSISSTLTSLRLNLYLSLVRSKLSYCSQLWRPWLIKDIKCLERVQRRASKFILNDYSYCRDYKSRLISLQLLPLMYWLEIQDIMFIIKCLKDPPDNFNLEDHVSFVSSTTRASTMNKLQHRYSRSTTTRHFYFNRVVRLWNVLPPFDLSLSYTSIKKLILKHFWDHFLLNFNPDSTCSFHFMCPCSSCSQTPLPH